MATNHRYTAAASKALLVVGKNVTISRSSSELIQDLRNSAASFGAKTDAKEIEKAWEIMQHRMYDLASHVAKMEYSYGVDRDTTMKF